MDYTLLKRHPQQSPERGTCVLLGQAGTQFGHNAGTERRSANYQPSIWSHDFFECLGNNYAATTFKMGKKKARAKELEQEVKGMINNEEAEPLAQLELIDDMERLGLGHLFQNHIRKALDRIIATGGLNNASVEKSLHATALYFRLLRCHCNEVSQDVFKKFKDHKGNFMACLCSDVKGLLSLHEASYHAFQGENLLEDAKQFTIKYLKEIKGKLETNNIMEEQVSHAVELPLLRRMERVEARWYIEAYGKRNDASHVLLELAKLDFNMVQSTFQNDLQDVLRWWKSVGLANKLRFARDRVTECFFSAVGMVCGPQFSDCRIRLTKVMALVSTLDDIYDVYGSLNELELFTEAVQRWDVHVVETLPQYMKVFFLALYNTVNEMASCILKEHGNNAISCLRKVWADLCQAFLLEARWSFTKCTPTFEEYIDNAWLSSSGSVILVHAYFLVSENITKEALYCLENYHGLLLWPSMLFRLYNDLVTSKAEMQRGESVNSIHCYMQENGVLEEEARDYIRSLIDETWKKMNKERVLDLPYPKPFIELVFNFARTVQCVYQYGDGHGAPDARIKTRVMSVIAEPIL